MDKALRHGLHNPITTARIDGWIEELQERGVPLQGLSILNAVSGELGLCSEMAVLLVQSVETRLEDEPLRVDATETGLRAASRSFWRTAERRA